MRSWKRSVLATLVSALFLLPLYWAFVAALRPLGLPPATAMEWWPSAPSWSNFPALFETLPMWQYAWNSVLVILIALPLTLIVASRAGFAMSQLPLRLRTYFFRYTVALLMLPSAALWMLRFQIYSRLEDAVKLLGFNSLGVWPLIFPALAATTPLFVLLFYWNFRRVPSELFEAARLDGASASAVFRHIALPLVRPTTMAIILLTFAFYWSDFVNPVVYIFDTNAYTLPVGLQILKQMDSTNLPLLMAGSILITLPVLLLFIVLQRYFLSELALGELFEKN